MPSHGFRAHGHRAFGMVYAFAIVTMSLARSPCLAMVKKVNIRTNNQFFNINMGGRRYYCYQAQIAVRLKKQLWCSLHFFSDASLCKLKLSQFQKDAGIISVKNGVKYFINKKIYYSILFGYVSMRNSSHIDR